MLLHVFMFYLLSFMMITSALMVVTRKNPVHSVLFLIFTFFNAAGLMVLLGAEFVAMLLVIVYVGAVAVLFLFVVMMLAVTQEQLKAGFARYLPLGIGLSLILLVELVLVLHASVQTPGFAMFNDSPMISAVPNTQSLGLVLYTDYFYPFQVSGLILLVAMVGAIVLTHRTRKDSRKQAIGEQVNRDVSHCIEIVDVEFRKGIH